MTDEALPVMPFPDNPFTGEGPILDEELPEEELQAWVNNLEASMMKDAMTGDNPLMGKAPHELVAIYLSAIPQGVRWLSEKVNIPRKTLSRYLETGEGVDPLKMPVIMDAILKKDTDDKARAAAKMARMSSTAKEDGEFKRSSASVSKKLRNKAPRYAGLTRAERRARMSEDRKLTGRSIRCETPEPL